MREASQKSVNSMGAGAYVASRRKTRVASLRNDAAVCQTSDIAVFNPTWHWSYTIKRVSRLMSLEARG